MDKVNNVRTSYTEVVKQTEKTEAKKPIESYKKIFEKLISVKNNVIAYLTHTKTHCVKSINRMISSLKSARSGKRRDSAMTESEDNGIVLLSVKSILDPHEQFEHDLTEQYTRLNENFHKNVADERYREQVIDSTFAAIYKDTISSFRIAGYPNKSDIPRDIDSAMISDYLEILGQAAKDWDVSCEEKNGSYIPKGAGANSLLNSVVSVMRKLHPDVMNDPATFEKTNEKVNNHINAMVDKYCVDNGLKSPLVFKSSLIDITENWQRNIDKDNSTDA